MNSPCRAILCFCEVNGAARLIDLGPRARILLRQTHSRIHGHNKLRKMLWKQLFDRLTNSVVFLSGEITKTASRLLLLLHQAGGIARHFAIPLALPEA